ncbi:hypothetical protein ACHQM5_016678 [Ranunculus cassubicifolius]
MEALHIRNENVSPGVDSFIRGTCLNPFLIYSPPSPCVDVCRSPNPDSARKIHPQLFLKPNSSLSPLRSPLASIENLQTPPSRSPSRAIFSKTPVKVEEDVLLMGGTPVKSPSPGTGSGSGRSVRPPLQPGHSPESPPGTGSGSGRFVRPPLQSVYSPDSTPGMGSGRFVRPPLQSGYSSESTPGTGSGSGRFVRPPLQSGYSPGSIRLHRTEICGSWEEAGTCSYGSRLAYVNQKEYLQPPQHSMINRPQGLGMLTTGGSYKLPANRQFGNNGGAALTRVNQQSSSIDWSPTDDGIVVRLPGASTDESSSSSSRMAIHLHTVGILYGSRSKQRLPFFKEICPE